MTKSNIGKLGQNKAPTDIVNPSRQNLEIKNDIAKPLKSVCRQNLHF